jgi:hypothetical protein
LVVDGEGRRARVYKDYGVNSLVKISPYKPLQGYTSLYKAISIFFKIRNTRTKPDDREGAACVGKRKDMHSQGALFARVSGRKCKRVQALARICKRMQGYFEF